jgi:hypothetical protein
MRKAKPSAKKSAAMSRFYMAAQMTRFIHLQAPETHLLLPRIQLKDSRPAFASTAPTNSVWCGVEAIFHIALPDSTGSTQVVQRSAVQQLINHFSI